MLRENNEGIGTIALSKHEGRKIEGRSLWLNSGGETTISKLLDK